ncbi:F-box/kelch-repeat protein At3g23880-like [Gastrolobium bilobum]|uniref:F-box/kelch-repeat protein At3g23880-like n=1 Tax=Gastrolobium bilobum TaxID=150636 RepID=UPI002AB20897|nr:F-box/kelch-repeat protein At3g23880-like [Gastrolobium bilobum]
MKMKMDLSFTLPDELIVEILLRLPVRSLLRFKCVCKSWLTFISDPQFAKSQFDLATPTHRLFLEPAYPPLVVPIDTEASLHDDSAIVHLTVPHTLFPSLHSYYLQIYGSCRGFILLRYVNYDNIFLWNPSTGAQKLLPYPHQLVPRYREEFLYGFGYDSSTDDYLIVIWVWHTDWKSDIHFFSFKTNSWNKTEGINFPHGDYLEEIFRFGLLLNGALHWLAYPNGSVIHNTIVAFDLTERSLLEIPLPHNLTMAMMAECYNLVVIGGCLSLCNELSMETGAMVNIWTMKEYKVQSSWTTTRVSYTCDIGDNFSPLWFTEDGTWDLFSPLWFTKGGDIVVGSKFSGVLMKLNDKGELLEYHTHSPFLEVVEDRRHSPFLITAMYRESLLSLPDLGKAKDDHH